MKIKTIKVNPENVGQFLALDHVRKEWEHEYREVLERRIMIALGRSFPRYLNEVQDLEARSEEFKASEPPKPIYARRPIPQFLRREILHSGAVCHYCGEPATTIDHKVPVLHGGSVNRENLLPCCSECNRLKKAKSYAEFAGRAK